MNQTFNFINQSKCLISKLLNQGYQSDGLKVAVKKFCGRYIFLFGIFSKSVSQFTNDLLYIFLSIVTKPRILPNPYYDSILWELIYDLDCDIYLFLYFNVMCFHVCHRLGRGWLSTSHRSCWPLSDVVPVLSYVSCTHALWFLHGREVLLFMWCECIYCYQFCRKMDLAYWKLILSA